MAAADDVDRGPSGPGSPAAILAVPQPRRWRGAARRARRRERDGRPLALATLRRAGAVLDVDPADHAVVDDVDARACVRVRARVRWWSLAQRGTVARRSPRPSPSTAWAGDRSRAAFAISCARSTPCACGRGREYFTDAGGSWVSSWDELAYRPRAPAQARAARFTRRAARPCTATSRRPTSSRSDYRRVVPAAMRGQCGMAGRPQVTTTSRVSCSRAGARSGCGPRPPDRGSDARAASNRSRRKRGRASPPRAAADRCAARSARGRADRPSLHRARRCRRGARQAIRLPAPIRARRRKRVGPAREAAPRDIDDALLPVRHVSRRRLRVARRGARRSLRCRLRGAAGRAGRCRRVHCTRSPAPVKDAKRPRTPPAGLPERALLLALLLLAFMRGLALLAHEPLIAIANDVRQRARAGVRGCPSGRRFAGAAGRRTATRCRSSVTSSVSTAKRPAIRRAKPCSRSPRIH